MLCEQVLKNNKRISILNLNNNNISAPVMKKIFNTLKGNTNIKRLFLEGNTANDEVVAKVCEFLQDNTTLEVLGLGNNISDQGAARIRKACTNNKIALRLK